VEGGRFGFCYENGQLKKVLDRIVKMDHVDLCGIHLHCSSKSRSLNIYRTIAKIACEIKMAYGLNLQYVDVGGGFFGGLANKPTFKDYLSVIAEELEKAFDKEQTKLIVSSPFSFITSVIDVKETTQNRFVVTDGSRNDVDPLRHKKSYFYRIEAKKEKKIDKQVICGYTCMEDDRLFEIRDGQELSVGDRIIYEKVGAYTMCLSALFIKYFPPVYLNKGNQIHCVREKWTAADFLMQSNSEI
jgi:diaminopimelate decarboxylase